MGDCAKITQLKSKNVCMCKLLSANHVYLYTIIYYGVLCSMYCTVYMQQTNKTRSARCILFIIYIYTGWFSSGG